MVGLTAKNAREDGKMPESINDHIEWFKAYAKRKIEACDKDRSPLEIKLDHTMRVLENAGAIASGEKFPESLKRACLLAGLYHDLARFDQYLHFGTFRDAISFNHGWAAVRMLRKEDRLQNEDAETARLVLAAIACHNRRALPSAMRGELALVANALRNADKLDIVRIMAEHLAHKPYNPTVILSLPDDDSLCGKKVIDDALAGRTALYEDLRSVNDFRVLLGTWHNDLQFESSRRLYIEMGNGREVVAALPDNDSYGEVRKFLLEIFDSE